MDRSRFIHLAHNAEIAWRDRIVEVGEIPPLTPVRLHGVVAPADYSQIFGHIVTRIEVDPEAAIFAHLNSPEGVSSPDADFDGNGQVGFGDFFRFADAFGRADFNPLFDLDGDGQVGFGDFFVFSDLFGRGAAKALVKAPWSQVDGSFLLEVYSEDGEVVLDLRSVDVQLSGYGAVVEYDVAAFHLVEVTDERSTLAQPLRLIREGYGEVQIAGSATGGGQSAGGCWSSCALRRLQWRPPAYSA